jgi:hypothetical protein
VRKYPNRKDKRDEEGGKNMSEPTKEYWQAKADLCKATALQQLEDANSYEAMKNLERMVYALSRVGIENKREGEGNE